MLPLTAINGERSQKSYGNFSIALLLLLYYMMYYLIIYHIACHRLYILCIPYNIYLYIYLAREERNDPLAGLLRETFRRKFIIIATRGVISIKNTTLN